MKSEVEIFEAVARGWCHEHNSAKEMDTMLGEAIAVEVLAVVRPLVAERDDLREELDGAVKLREAADAYSTRVERERDAAVEQARVMRKALEDCAQWFEGMALGENAQLVRRYLAGLPLTPAEGELERLRALLATLHCDHIRDLCRSCPACETCHEENGFRWLDGDELGAALAAKEAPDGLAE